MGRYAAISRRREKVQAAALKPGARPRKLNIEVKVERLKSWASGSANNYKARACIGKFTLSARSYQREASGRCTVAVGGQTPTDAIRGALERLIDDIG